MQRLRITVEEVPIIAELRETPTAAALFAAAPFESTASTWGDEVYFRTPVDAEPEPDAKTVIEPGELAFWLDGASIALCFGPTPASYGNEARLISPGNIFGDSVDDLGALRSVRAGARVRVEPLG